MAVLHYKPWLLCLLAAVANYFRVRDLGQRAPQKFGGSDIPLPLFYGASYGYL
ncbi:MAG: hypothetical protein GWM98_02765, partial [Nitrospinaceae bacterium]|nr:hypothetical protein [Nitrospinaceae bacterium]NIS84025.1 hypothetical protein [Nitrospinaceae bacterium]NIU43138.1 hypothetical protein [Nitrospinaceae bacterium]NIU95227.1 hypothetical protein [Nitrospinaceae bacterium]NIW04727.1 hypothetical protein [Nitrospinaceae bacterium]